MSYIGREPQIGNFQVCDAISVVNGQAAYTMQVGGANVSPETANHMIVSLNGIIQAPGTSYTVSGSTITFASNLATGDVINFIHILGSVLDLGVPSDDTVGAAQIKDDLISGTTALASEPADTDEFLVSDAGTLKRIDYSLIKGGGLHTLLTTTNVTSGVSEVAFTSNIDSTYRRYKITWDSLIPATDGAQLNTQLYIGGAYKTDSYYNYVHREFNAGGSVGSTNSTTNGSFRLMGDGVGSDTGENANGELIIYTPSDTTEKKMISWTCSHQRNDLEMCHGIGAGHYNNGESACTGIKLYMSSGNIATGLFKLYGIT